MASKEFLSNFLRIVSGPRLAFLAFVAAGGYLSLDRALDLKGDPHTNPIHLLSNVMIFAGFYLTYRAWLVFTQHSHSKKGNLPPLAPTA